MMFHYLFPRVCAFLLLPALLTAGDPKPPVGGFAVRSYLNQVHSYYDGYKTRIDVRLPDPAKVTPPATGWPCMLFVHGSGGSRKSFGNKALAYAKLGYVTICYDVRGQGDSARLNPTTGYDRRKFRLEGDMAEILNLAETRLKANMDFNRIGVTGGSQGGAHSWLAGAWSGQVLPVARGTVKTFPKILAIAPMAASGFFGVDRGQTFNAHGVLRNSGKPSLKIDPAYQKITLDFFRKQDFVGKKAFAKSIAGNTAVWASKSIVPVFVHISWTDILMDPSRITESFAQLPATTPKMVMISTGHHGSPKNLYETVWGSAVRQRWFAHYLKGTKDELASWDRYQLAKIPSDRTAFLNRQTVWMNRNFANFPVTAGSTQKTFYLRTGSVLSEQAPGGVEAVDWIDHKVSASFTPQAYLNAKGALSQVLAGIPLSQQKYQTASLGSDLELCGRPELAIWIDSSAPNLLVHASLIDVPPVGAARYISSGHMALRGRKAGKEKVIIPLRDLYMALPKGHKLLLTIQNHAIENYSTGVRLSQAPYFESARYSILHSNVAVSSLSLRTRPRDLMARTNQIQLPQSTGRIVNYPIDGGVGRAGHLYLTLLSNSGAAPGFSFVGERIPLNIDIWTGLGITLAGPAPFQAFVGVLSAQGKATPSLRIPAASLDKTMIGTAFTFAAVSFDKSFRMSASAFSQALITP